MISESEDESEDEDEQISADAWPLAPGEHASYRDPTSIVPGVPTVNPLREKAIEDWVHYYNNTTATLPHVRLANRSLPKALLERGDPSRGGRPLRACKFVFSTHPINMILM